MSDGDKNFVDSDLKKLISTAKEMREKKNE